MVKHHVGATKNTDSGREWTNCNKMLIKEKGKKNQLETITHQFHWPSLVNFDVSPNPLVNDKFL